MIWRALLWPKQIFAHLNGNFIYLELLNTVFVDEVNGTNNISCGSTRRRPCRNLSEGVRRTKQFGIVHVVGDQHLQQTIFLSKSIHIISDNMHEGTITSDGEVDFAFNLKCHEDLKVKLKGLFFWNIGVIEVQCDVDKPGIDFTILLTSILHCGA